MNIKNSQFIKQIPIAKKKKLFKRVKIDIITYLYVESKFCRRFQDVERDSDSAKAISRE